MIRGGAELIKQIALVCSLHERPLLRLETEPFGSLVPQMGFKEASLHSC